MRGMMRGIQLVVEGNGDWGGIWQKVEQHRSLIGCQDVVSAGRAHHAVVELKHYVRLPLKSNWAATAVVPLRATLDRARECFIGRETFLKYLHEPLQMLPVLAVPTSPLPRECKAALKLPMVQSLQPCDRVPSTKTLALFLLFFVKTLRPGGHRHRSAGYTAKSGARLGRQAAQLDAGS